MLTNKLALVTGVSSGIGYCIMNELLEKNCSVLGIVRSAEKKKDLEQSLAAPGSSPHGIAPTLIACDLAVPSQIEALAGRLHQEGLSPDILVLNAGVGFYGPHEELSVKAISSMTAVNLTAPLLLTNLFLRDIKANKGHILFISSVTAQKTNNTHGCAYGATKAGISSFAKSLFEEVRKYDVRVTVISPDLTRTNLYRSASFMASDEVDASLSPEEIADCALFALTARDGLNLTELTVQPQHHRISRKKKPPFDFS